MFKVAPLPGTFFLTSILGFIVSAMYISQLSKTWSFTFCLFFVFMFLASFISMTKADSVAQLEMDFGKQD